MTKKKLVYWFLVTFIVLGVWIKFFTYWGRGYPPGFGKNTGYASEYVESKVLIVSKDALKRLVQGGYESVRDERHDYDLRDPRGRNLYRVVLVWNKGPKQAWGYTEHFTSPILPPNMDRPYVYAVSRASYKTIDEKVAWENFYVER